MAITIKFDSANNPLPARLILATKAGNKIRELPISDVKFRDTFLSGSEFSFNVYKNQCLTKSGEIDESFWRRIVDFKLAYCPEYDLWYEIHLDLDESDETIKSCTAVSLGEAELSQINLYGIEINTEADIARENYKPTVLYDPEDKEVSLVDRLLYKAPHYRVKHVDYTIANIQRSFSFNDISIFDAYQDVATEYNCIFIIEARKGVDSKIDRTISVYDAENYCLDCRNRGEFSGVCDKCGSTNIKYGYGEDTSIFVSRKNLAQEINYSTDVDSVKNCFRLEGGDDLMTATIINCNPNGSQYLWYITDAMKSDMSEALRQKLSDYDSMYEAYQSTESYSPPANLRNQYNQIVQKYIGVKSDLEEIPENIVGFPALMTAYYNTIDLQMFLNNSLMPNVETETTTAAQEAAKLTVNALSPVAVANLASCTETTASSAALSVAKCLVRGSFQVKINDSSYNSSSYRWTGNFKVTNYSDEEDVAISQTVTLQITTDMETYVKQKIAKAMTQQSDDPSSITDLFNLTLVEFKEEMTKYSLQRLLAFREACQVALDIMIQQGVADRKNWVGSQNNLYDNMYLPYYNKMAAIEDEINVRTTELSVVVGVYDENGGILIDGMQSVILAKRNEVQAILNFEEYLGEDLWLEFASFRREDTFTNKNYISDGLSNEEIFTRAEEFLNLARKEIYRSAVLQHSISSTLSNLLTMREFQPLINKFKVGNWLRIEVDGEIYRLRLVEYTIDYSSWKLSSVEFSDVKKGYNSASDIQSLLSAVRSMSSSYGTVSRQAKAGKKTQVEIDNWLTDGFKLTSKIVGGAANQEFVIDESGITGREYIPETEGYKDEQVKIISSGLYVTDDGWLTAKAGVGRFAYYNPQTRQMEEAYGVIADTIVGNLILSQEVGIYNETGSITLDKDGFTLITEAGANAKTFRILRQEDDVLVNILSIDSMGNLLLNGYSTTGEMNSAISASVQSLTTEFNQKLQGYDTKQEVNSKIEQSATNILQTVSSTYMKTNDARAEFAAKSSTIKNVETQYAVGDDDQVAPSEGWSTESPEWEEGKFIWQRTKTINGNDQASYSEPVCIQGAAGVGIYSIADYYAVNNDYNTPPADASFGTEVPQMTASNPYLWNYEVTTFSDQTTSTTAKRVIGVFGSNGRGITSVVEYYAKSSNGSTAPADSSFNTTVPTLDSTDKYLWTYEQINYTDGTNPTKTAKRVIGMYSEDGVGITAVRNYYLASSQSSGVTRQTQGWTTAVQSTTSTLRYLWNYEEIVYTVGNPGYTDPAIIGMYSDDGLNGYNVARIYLYQRATSAPSKPSSEITYTFDTGAISGTLGNWSTTIPSGDDPIYITAATASSRENIDTIAANEWSNPAVLSQSGTNGLSSATVFLYQRAASASAISAPNSNLTYTFATGVLSGELGNWSRIIPTSDGNPCFVIQATAISSSATDVIEPSEWSAITQFVEDGSDGRGISQITNHYLATNLQTGVTRDTPGWTEQVQSVTTVNKYLWNYETITYTEGQPSNTNPVIIGVYGDTGLTGRGITSITEYYAKSPSNTEAPADSKFTTTMQTVDSVNRYLWSYELITYTDTTTGNTSKRVIGQYSADGSNGLNNAIVYLYKRSVAAATIDWSDTLTYSFTAKALTTVPTGWSQTVPAGDNPLYMTLATASSATTTDTIASSEWSTPVIVASNGIDGMNAATVYLYKRADSASIDWENTLTYTFASGALSEVPTGWSQTIPTGDLPIYITFATASSRTATDTIAASEWATPEVLARNGNSAITVVLTNESHIFAGDTEHVIPATVNCGIAAYKGATPVAVTIGTIANVPTGMTVTPSGSGTTNASIAIAVTAAMTSMSGTLNIPVTVDGFSFTKVFSYSVALNGESATSYDLNVSHAAVKKSEAGVYTPTAITLSAKSQTGESAIDDYSGRFKIETTANNTTWTQRYLSSADESSHSYTIPADIVAIRCSLYASGGTTTLLDQQTVPIVFDGENGISITEVTNYYLATPLSTGVTTETSGWTDTVQTVTAVNKYLWNYEEISYSNNTTSHTDPCIIGVYGDTGSAGATGKGVSALLEQYYLSTSNTTQTGGSWSSAQPEWEEDHYIWERTQITWLESDGTTSITYTTPVLAQALNGANEIANQVQADLIENYSTTEQTDTMIQNTVRSYQKIIDTKADNLISYPYEHSGEYSESGLTITVNDDGSVVVTGTATANVFLYLTQFTDEETLPAGVYTLSMGDTAVEGAELWWFRKPIGSQTQINVATAAPQAAAVNYNYPDDHIALFLLFKSGYTFSFTAYPQLEYGSVGHNWQPTAKSYTSQIKQTATDIELRVESMEEIVESMGSQNLIPCPYKVIYTTAGAISSQWEPGKSYVISGVTFTIEIDGSITVDGTATDNITRDLITNGQKYTLPNGTYTLCGNATASGIGMRPYRFPNYDGSSQIFPLIPQFDASLEGGSQFTWSTIVDNYEQFFVIRIVIASGAVFDNVIFKPMLEVGSTAHNWVSPVNSTNSKIVSSESSIRQNANSIVLKVSVGDVSSTISQESGAVSIQANRMTITSDNFQLAANGEVTSNGVFTSKGVSPNYSTVQVRSVLNGGQLEFYKDDNKVGRYGTWISGANSTVYGLLVTNDLSTATVIGVYDSERNDIVANKSIWVNNGANFASYTESFVVGGTSRFIGSPQFPEYIYFNGCSIEAGSWSGGKYVQFGTRSSAFNDRSVDVFVTGDLYKQGSLNRVVSTENYGKVLLNAVESTYCLFSDLGSGTIDETGKCYIWLDADFVETIDINHEYHVYTTQTSQGNILYVEKHMDHFIVYGVANTTFDWICYAKQRDYSNDRLERFNLDAFTKDSDDNSSVADIFSGDDIGEARSIDYMNSFYDDYDEQAERYMKMYESEIEII